MGVFGAMLTAVSGLQAQSYALENVAGNIANSQTVGFKRVDTGFVDLLPELPPRQSVAGSVGAFSRGTTTIQGSLQSTGIGTNVAISGQGFFVVQQSNGFANNVPVFAGVDLYTRAGDFALDKDGFLVKGGGFYLKGSSIDPVTGQVLGSASGVIQLSNVPIPAKKTEVITYNANLATFPNTANADPAVPQSELLDPADFTVNPTTAGTNTVVANDLNRVTIVLDLPDGTRETIEFVARATLNPASQDNAFAIGATPNATAANLAGAVQTLVAKTAATKLSAASAQVAAADFFAGSLGSPPLRVAGPPFDAAVATVPGTALDTVVWYTGDDTAPSARGTAPVRIDTTHAVLTGAQANEAAFRTVMAQLGVLAVQTFPAGDADARARYEANAERVRTELGFPGGAQSVTSIATELALAHATMRDAKSRHDSTSALLRSSIDSIENASTEEVAAAILALQTRLQASYQTTAILSQLTLTKYI